MDACKRAARTFLQAFLGVFVGTGILSAIAADGAVDWPVIAKAGVAAAAAGLVAVVSYVQNLLEDKGKIPVIIEK